MIDDVPFSQITTGAYHACGLQADGTALCWGRNRNRSLNIPDGLTFSQISAGFNFNCGLRDDGAIACWGKNDYGQTSPPKGLFNDVAVGRDHACALSGDGLTCWGKGFPDGAEAIQGIPLLSNIQAGAGFVCGLTSDDDLACWNNDRRELAITIGSFISLGVGLRHACAIKSDGSVFCNDEDKNHYSLRSQPPSTKFVQIAGGSHHACGITESADIECWGSGMPGAPGERLNAPEGKFAAISIGWSKSCALRPDGYATCWRQRDVQNLEQLSEAFGGIKFRSPTEIFPLPSGRLAVVEREGSIVAYFDEPNAAPPQMMLDLTHKVVCCEEEQGMLSAALDPRFEEFPFLYVYHSAASDDTSEFVGRLTRFLVEGEQAVADSELTILEMPQSNPEHNGGAIRFGPDGMLYLGVGENGLRDEAQLLNNLLGKIIRIDVRGATPEQPYVVPPDNPFVDNPEARAEIWAYGLRNPWRMDFAPDGRLFVADVGGWIQEEISIATAGANLGWPQCKGADCRSDVDVDADGLTTPIFAYDSREDGCAIIGGVTVPWLDDGFVFGDLCRSEVRLLEEDEQESWRARTLATKPRRSTLSFGIGADGTVYVLSAFSPIMRLQPGAVE